MEAKSFVLVGLFYLISSVESNQNYPLLASKVQILETHVQILSSLLQSQSNILTRHIAQGHNGGGTTDGTAAENSAKIVQHAKDIKELKEKVASLDNLSKSQEAKIKQLNDELTKLKNANSNGSSVDVTVVNQKLHALSTASKAHDFKIQRLESAMTSTKTDVKTIKEDPRLGRMAQKISALQTASKAHDSQISSLQWAKTSANIRINQNQKNSIALEVKVRAQASQISRLQSSVGTWASGKYCILASGSCPAGFTRVTAWMKALKVFRGTGGYFKQANFGDSNIRCHGPCSRADQWVGELTIVACCK